MEPMCAEVIGGRRESSGRENLTGIACQLAV